MARTSTSVGMGITVTILGVLTFAFFVTSIIFYGQMNQARNELNDFQASQAEWVTPQDQQDDRVRVYADLASSERQSTIGFLTEALDEAIEIGLGGGGSLQQLREQNERLSGGSSRGLAGAVRARDGQIAQLNTRITQLESDLGGARESLLAEQASVNQIRSNFERQLADVTAQVDQYRDEVESYRSGVNSAEVSMDERVDRLRADARDTEARLQDDIRRLEGENLRLQDTVARLQQEKAGDLLTPTDEFALVDGDVVGLNTVDNEVFLSLGRRDKIRLGMRFQVYADPSVIRPDADGNYPAGKATVEVVSIGENESAARVVRSIQGNPVVRGDVVANPVYDPNKVYTFLVYGLFDVNNDGRASQLERDELRAQIERWGGRMTDELTGDVDFLVLGRRPTLPPPPPASAPLPVQNEFVRLSRVVRRYDDLQDRATRTGLPILNENRLGTLLDGR